MPKTTNSQKDNFPHSKGNIIASWVFGAILLAFLVAIIFLLPEPSESQRVGIRFLMSLGAAFLSYFFVGGVVLHGKLAGNAVGGGGGFALFILIQFVFDPFSVKTNLANAVPSAIPRDETIFFAQKALKESGFYSGEINGIADSKTREAIKQFQADRGLTPDGFVGKKTKEVLTTIGPKGAKVVFEVDENGTVNFVTGWSESDIISVSIPQLSGVPGVSQNGNVLFYKDAAADLQAAFEQIEREGLIKDVLSWDGSFVPRVARRLRKPSIHAYGLAFDINAKWHLLGKRPPSNEEKGSVLRLVPIFERNGFRWGGNFPLPDGNHFEYVRLSKSAQQGATPAPMPPLRYSTGGG